MLLDLGADPNVQDRKGVTALMLSCKGRNEGAVKALKRYGARLDIVDKVGYSTTSVTLAFNHWSIFYS